MSALRLRGRIGIALVASALLAALMVPGADAAVVAEPGPIQIVPYSGYLKLKDTMIDLTPTGLPQCSNFGDDDGDNLPDLLDPGCAVGPNGEPAEADDSELVAGHQPMEETVLIGSIDADGNVVMPKSTVQFPKAFIAVQGSVVTAQVIPTHDAEGTVNPVTGAGTLRVRLRVKLEGAPLGVPLGNACTIGTNNNPIDVTFTTGVSTAPNGSTLAGTYNVNLGILSIVNNNFVVPGAWGCGQFVNLNSTINGAVGVPSWSGLNEAKLVGEVMPNPQAPVSTTTTATTTTAPTTTTTTTTTAPPPTTTTTTAPPTTTTTTTAPPTTTTTTTTAPPTTTTTTTAPPTTTTTTVPGPASDEMSVEISGATTYSAGGPFSPGIVNVSQGGNRVGAVGSVEGPEGGSARLGARVIPVPWLRLSIGRVWVSDRSAGVHLVLPYVGRPNVDGDTVSGVAKGLQWVDGPRYVAPVEIAWTVRDLD